MFNNKQHPVLKKQLVILPPFHAIILFNFFLIQTFLYLTILIEKCSNIYNTK